jgi:hypothetical protein
LSHKTDLERSIHQSYTLIREYERIIGTSNRPEEQMRARGIIGQQWALIEDYLSEYRLLASKAYPEDIVAIETASHTWQQSLEALSRRATPFMVDDLPPGFVPRPIEYERLIAHLLDERDTPVAITAALRGAGGYGKTTLAQAICHDERIRAAFPDGILWVTLGQSPDLLAALHMLYTALSGWVATSTTVEGATNELVRQLNDKACLLVVDDVWNEAHLRPLLRGGDRCARLVTTRIGDTLPRGARTVDVDAMQRDEALSLLAFGLPPADLQVMRALATRLGEWPLLLKLANGALRQRVDRYRQSLPDALTYVDRALNRRGLTAFDARDAQARDQAVAMTLGVSLGLLSEEERARYEELAVFPEDADVPLVTLEKLWGATGGLDDLDVEDLCVRLGQLSLLQRCDLEERRIRLHDVVCAYLVQACGDRLPALHGQLLDAYALDRWPDLPPDEPYLWRRLAYHLREAERGDELRALLLDYDWLETKLGATDVNALLGDYGMALSSRPTSARLRVGSLLHMQKEESLHLVHDAIRLSAHLLAQDKAHLRSQIWGRLLSCQSAEVRSLRDQARGQREHPWLRLLTPTLMQPGAPLVRTLIGHTAPVRAVAVTPDGQLAVSAYSDKTLKVWDLEGGAELRSLAGHTAAVWAVAVTHSQGMGPGERGGTALPDRPYRRSLGGGGDPRWRTCGVRFLRQNPQSVGSEERR